MKVDLGIWDKLAKLITVLLVVAGLLAVVLWYLPLIRHNERLRKEIQRLDQDLKREEEQSRRLRSTIDAVSHDPKTVERLAREKLGYARTGETIFRFETPLTNAPAVGSPSPGRTP